MFYSSNWHKTVCNWGNQFFATVYEKLLQTYVRNWKWQNPWKLNFTTPFIYDSFDLIHMSIFFIYLHHNYSFVHHPNTTLDVTEKNFNLPLVFWIPYPRWRSMCYAYWSLTHQPILGQWQVENVYFRIFTYDMRLFLGELNEIASFMSTIYLCAYALLNACTFHAAHFESLGWRPSYKVQDDNKYLHDDRFVQKAERETAVCDRNEKGWERKARVGAPSQVHVNYREEASKRRITVGFQ